MTKSSLNSSEPNTELDKRDLLEDDCNQSKVEHYYLENGFMVFTKAYHLSRGFCCGNTCRHCPYDHENV
ncbi:MAG: hypothetical protein KTR16_14640 [Acidiferrobacterales bacterium]|nr:hypothetical protein [Acidiferrobacterales bacterium]